MYYCSYVALIIQIMSKAKGKDKKNENGPDQELIEQQKREILEQSFTIKRIQDRLSRLTEENYEITSTKDKFQLNYEERIDKQRIIIESHQNNIKENRAKIYELEVNKMTLQNKIKDLDRQLRDQQANKNREFQEYRRVTQNQIAKLQLQLKEYNIYMSERDEMNYQNSHLKKSVENEKEDRIRQVADKEREKVQAIDRLRDEMLTKIKDMRSNLLSLKKEQLDTTTRLAVLQNHQLTSELQFQSKQSEKLIFQNENLLKKNGNLQKDLQIHKEIEEELAKRSHYSRGIIKKLTARITQLEQSLREAEERANSSKLQKATNKTSTDDFKREEVIKVLDKSLENSEKKYIKLQSESETAKNQIAMMRGKIEQYEKRVNALIELLLKSYAQFQEGRLEAREGEYKIDLKNIRSKDVTEWSKDELRLVVNALLQQLSVLLTKKNMGLPSYHRPEQFSVLDSDEIINNIRLPKIAEHSINSKLELSMKLKELPVSMGSRLVGSQIRDWGRSVHSSSHSNLIRKYKMIDNNK